MNKQEKEKTEALRKLKQLCKGQRVYAKVTHVSKSGMSRDITFRVLKGNKLYNITGLIQKITGYSWSRNDWDSIHVGGCGMDMIFNTLYVVNGYAIKYGVIRHTKNKTDHDLRYNGLVNTNYYSL